MKTRLAAVFACAICGMATAQEPGGPRPDGADEAIHDQVDEFVSRAMTRRHIPGVSIAVVAGGKPTLIRSYGMANAELLAPATADTVYQIASVTKPFTATLVLKLAKAGKFSLDDRIAGRLPGLPGAWGEVTVRHLLNHTSGIKDYTSTPGFDKAPHKRYAPRELLDLVASAPLEFATGAEWRYSNTNYVLLGMLIEEATGRPYAAAIAEQVLLPLGLTRTRANDLHAVIPGRAQGYRWDGKALENAEIVSPTQPFAAGMLVSTIGDLVKWDAALAGHAILDGPELERMWSPTRLRDGKEAGYGLGWEVARVNGHRRASHGGAIPGFSAEIQRYLDDKLTVIVLTNLGGGRADALARGIAGLYVPELAERPADPIADPDPQTTLRLRGLFEGALRGEPDESQFEEQARSRIVPSIRADRERLASFGALKSFQLLEREDREPGLHLRYRAALENQVVVLTFDLDRAGKIRGAGIQLED